MKVRLVGYTVAQLHNMCDAAGHQWIPDNDGDAGDLAEFAGRQCYESWDRPNPATATNSGYLANIIRQQHLSVLEHGTVSFHIEDVSRALTHELVRHRHFSFSQVSQRYVNPVDSQREHGPVVPPLFESNEQAKTRILDAWVVAVRAYRALMVLGEEECKAKGITGHRAKKMVREAARAVLPNMTPTSIVVTANHHAWFDWMAKRGTIHADQEIRALACEVLRQLKIVEPRIYWDWQVEELQDNGYHTEVIKFHAG